MIVEKILFYSDLQQYFKTTTKSIRRIRGINPGITDARVGNTYKVKTKNKRHKVNCIIIRKKKGEKHAKI